MAQELSREKSIIRFDQRNKGSIGSNQILEKRELSSEKMIKKIILGVTRRIELLLALITLQTQCIIPSLETSGQN